MTEDTIPTPHLFQGVMVSSTFQDLQSHRARLLEALRREKLFPLSMESYVPVPGDDVISSSLRMVREASAYVGLISHRYGQVVESPERNPQSYSVSRLEFEEAQRLGLPTLVFIMGDDHDVKEKGVELDPEKREKLEAYRTRAKEGRIYVVFNSLEDFTEQAIHAVASLRRYLEEQAPSPSRPAPAGAYTGARDNPIPAPPTFYAEPSYIGSHEFVGRRAELDRLSDWAASADPHPVLLYEAIGGTGKSMLTWEWTTRHSTEVRGDWAGRFWYSFYEKGAIMADFCRRALAYITGRPLEELRRKKTAELGEQLLRHLQSRPWLLILDGLERVLVAYHRYDAAQLADEDADTSKDQIARRDPCAAIRPEDDDLLRLLASAAPSKLLITTRLTPRVLLNPSSQGIQGVLRVPLPGLRPADAERLIRACGVSGDSAAMQDYLKRHCNCHPLVTGVLAGLIKNYLPDRGNFDTWAADETTEGGGRLNLADLDLIQKRNHILLTALAALPDKSRQLLSTLALLSESADYPTLSALNPHLPPDPTEVAVPGNPEGNEWLWGLMSEKRKKEAQEEYQEAVLRREKYEQAVRSRLNSPEFRSARSKLVDTVRDLESRGLLQYDHQTKRYDLHPVVRGVAAGQLRQEEKEQYGQRVVDHFSGQAHNPYEEAETLEDVRYGLNIVRTLIQMGRYEQAADFYIGDLSNALLFNLEANAEVLSLLRQFFVQGWVTLSDLLSEHSKGSVANSAALALHGSGNAKEALSVWLALLPTRLKAEDWWRSLNFLSSVSAALYAQGRLAKAECWQTFALEIADLIADNNRLFTQRLSRFVLLSTRGAWDDAEAMWQLLDPMGRDWLRAIYRQGDAEHDYAVFHLYRGTLQEEHLAHAEKIARAGKNRQVVRSLLSFRGTWQLEQGRWADAAECFQEAVRMAREIGQHDTAAEVGLLLAKFKAGQIPAPRDEAEQMAQAKERSHQMLAELWLAMGDHEQAKKHALAAYKGAWADGEPYVFRHALNKARALLGQLGAEIPDLPPYDPAKDEKLPWEEEVVAAIEILRAEKEAERKAQESEKEKRASRKTRRPSSSS